MDSEGPDQTAWMYKQIWNLLSAFADNIFWHGAAPMRNIILTFPRKNR